MKSVLATLALSTLATASPLLNGEVNRIVRRTNDEPKPDMAGVPFYYTSTYAIKATPDQVVDSENEFTGGLEGATGWFLYGINSHENVICYNITIDGFRGDFESPANTATHIHEGKRGMAGPPRIAFPNPTGEDGHINTVGCLKGPFETGVVNNGTDTGEGFHVKQIEQSPSSFFTDIHSSEAVPGAVRGQMGPDEC
ncbi:CHRD domain-containing protein [Sarocladium implicatum]|nr:CHRD domain-containing protein [Sarocladium implicatum]